MNLHITDLLDEYDAQRVPMDEAAVPNTDRIKEATMKKLHKRPVRPLRIALVAAVIVLLAGCSALAVRYYTLNADKMESNWNSHDTSEMTAEQKDFIDDRSADLDLSCTDQGITMAVQSVTCTSDTVYLTYIITFDEALYDIENMDSCMVAGIDLYVENTTYGTSTSTRGRGNGSIKDGVYTQTSTLEFDDLPEGMVLNDGETTLYATISQLLLDIWSDGDEPETTEVTGTWSFSFLLPAADATETQTSEEELSFSSDVSLIITDISVTESSCNFTVETDDDTYVFTTSEMLALAAAAEPDAVMFTVDALLADGSTVPSTGGGMHYNEETGLDDWSLAWIAPVDPSTVVALIFGDGTTEYEIPLDG